MKALLDLLLQAGDNPGIGFIGSRARTTFADEDQLLDLLVDASTIHPFVPVHGGKPPFDMMVAHCTKNAGITALFCGDGAADDYTSRLDPYVLSPDMLKHIAMLVVFPREGEQVLDTDPLVELAAFTGIPVVGVRRSGELEIL